MAGGGYLSGQLGGQLNAGDLDRERLVQGDRDRVPPAYGISTRALVHATADQRLGSRMTSYGMPLI